MSLFFFIDAAPSEIYTLSLHDALPISAARPVRRVGVPDPGRCDLRHGAPVRRAGAAPARQERDGDRKSTRLNSSHSQISYAVFCLKKKNMSQILFMVEILLLAF